MSKILAILLSLGFVLARDSYNRLLDIDTVEKYLDVCPESEGEKAKPSPEPDLKACSEWSSSSCCSPEVAVLVEKAELHGFSFDFCGPMSNECRKYFHLDYCMIKCSPHMGPWLVALSRSKFREKIFRVPLCESDCNAWFKACRKDRTCTVNWQSGGFDWSNGTNQCREGFECETIEKVYGSAKDFCEQVFDHSYRVVPVESRVIWNATDFHCMHIPEGENDRRAAKIIEHNYGVAKRQAENIIKRVYGHN